MPQEPAPPLVQALRAGALDALISRYPARWPQTPGQPLRYEKRLDAGFAVIAPAGHALARARCVDWQRLAQAPWIMPAASAMLRRLIDDAFRREGLPAPIIGSNCPSTNIHLVAAGLGLSAVPQVLMRAALAAGQMARVRAAPGIRPGPVVLICREAAEQPARGHVA
ncbi:LysR substrate-binding domain-containing protein [Verminephrobacter eiseniae]|uniref:LysR substrate-binding domain-containing protein n=1 Tax=Verminephrobacter eiseniae TaxID=364317 RepID=UPI0022370E61|nr:LysR substrate-binding domain-containing protein [Verminephrobacter eiseniae]